MNVTFILFIKLNNKYGSKYCYTAIKFLLKNCFSCKSSLCYLLWYNYSHAIINVNTFDAL